ncbi:MAG: glycosyltransferase family 39 protein [Elusimicrobia bacterium]|nr:glycosyltransferase family 39 protein [Elusimicrobiota bacterium]
MPRVSASSLRRWVEEHPWDAAVYGTLAAYAGVVAARTARLPLFEWDEARNVMHAYEMMASGDWIASTYDGSLDLHYLKPPLLKWALALLFKLYGYSELAARLPSVVCGTAAGGVVFACLRRAGARPMFAAACGLALVTSTGFYGFHAMTSADVDAMVCFFDALSFAALCGVLLEDRPAPPWLLGVSVGLGLLTKSVVGLLPLAAVPFALVVRRDARRARLSVLAQALAVASCVALPWLAARDLLYPDHFLKQLVGYDVIERATAAQDAHEAGFWFYLTRARIDLGPWFYAVIGAAILIGERALRRSDHRGRDSRLLGVGVCALGAAAVCFLAFSCAQTKIRWYILPAYPLAFIAAGVGLELAARRLPARAVGAAAATLLAFNVSGLLKYESGRWSGVPLVDYVLFPNRELLRGKPLLLQGEMNQNAFVTARVYSGLKAASFTGDAPSLDVMLARRPDAEFLVSSQAHRYAGDPRLAPVAGMNFKDGTAVGLFRIVR